MEYICLFAPAFISLFLKYRAEENLKAKILNIICYYFIMVNIINLSVMIVAKLFFNNYSFEFTTSFSIKYLMLANVFAIIFPYIIEKLIVNRIIIKNKLVNFFVYIRRILFNIKKGICFVFDKIAKVVKKNNYNLVKKFLFMCFNLVFFIVVDIYLRKIAFDITGYYSISALYPNLFTVLYALFLGFIILLLSKKISRIFLGFVYGFNILLFLVNYMLLSIKSQAFSIYDLSNFNEGIQYLNFVIILVINFILLNKIVRNKNKAKINNYFNNYGIICFI